VLEHIEQPRELVGRVRRAADSNPALVVYFEVPNVLYTLRELGIWDVIYEHCSYFARSSLERLFVDVGFLPYRSYTAFGAQFTCLEAGLRAQDASASPAQGSESLEELAHLVGAFARHFREKLDHANERLRRMLKQGRRIALWGAGSKGVSFLSSVDGGSAIACAVDINPRKWGRFLPLSAITVVSPEELGRFEVDTVLVVNPLYETEIKNALERVGCQAELCLV
jgi:hypothetical protein